MIVEPTMTTMFTGTVAGGCELLPGSDVQFGVGQVSCGALSMYPFMDAGALTTPLNELFFQYCEPQKSTVVPMIGLPVAVPSAVMLPTTKSPVPGSEAVVSVVELLEDL